MPFQFNFYSSLLLIPFVHGLLFSVLLFIKKTNRYQYSNNVLGCILLLISIKIAYWMLGFAGWYDTHDTYTTVMFYFPFNNVIVLGPLLYLYLLSITNVSFRFNRIHLQHLWLPLTWFLLIIFKLLIDFSFYYPFANNASFQFGTKGPWAEMDKSVLITVISYGSFSYYLYNTIKAYHSYKNYTNQNFSFSEDIDFTWLRNLIYAIATGVILMFCYQIYNWISPLSYKADWYSYLFLGCLIYYISLKGYQMQFKHKPLLHFLPSTEQNKILAAEKIVIPDIEEWKVKLATLLETQRPYLLPELTLSGLAKLAETNNSVLSKIINEGFELNFNDFINQYRVNEVIRCIDLNHHAAKTLLGIAFDCGFNSKATFNRAFKKQVGQTPKAYADRNKPALSTTSTIF